MSENQSYLFDVDADVSKALSNLQKVASLMQNIENLRNKGQADYFTTNQKDMDKNMRSMKQLAKDYVDMQKQMSEISKKMKDASNMSAPEGSSQETVKFYQQQKKEATEAAKVIIQQQKSIQQAYVKTLMTFRELSSYQQNYSKNFKHLFSSNDTRNLPSMDRDAAKRVVRSMANDSDGTKLNEVTEQLKHVQKINRRSESISRRGAAANYLSTQQAASFKKDYRTVNNDFVKQRDQNIEELTTIGQNRGSLHRQVKQIEQNPMASQYDVDKKIAMQGEIEALDKEWDARMQLNKALEDSIAGMKKYNQALQGVEQKPERGTFKGMAYERAPAIGLALTGAMGGAVMNLYNKGAGLSRAMRPDEVSLGQWTNTPGNLWRSNIRNGALNAGLANRMGFSGQEMLGFESNYVANNGMTNMKDVNSAMMNQAQFSRVSGLSSQDTNDFMSSMFQTGAVKGNQVKDIQDGIIGALKRNGMEGREKEQVKALQSLVSGVSQGRTLSNGDIQNVMGLQSLLESTGMRSLQGQQGADLLNGMNQGIRNGITDPTVRMVMGQGTQYQGLAGRFALRKQLDKGISDPANIQKAAAFAKSYGGKNNAAQDEAFASFVQEKLGTNITGEQSQQLMDLYRSGKLSQSGISDVLNNNKKAGKKASASKLKNYQSSSAGTDNQSDATTQKQATELYDMGEIIRKVNADMGGLNAALYAAIIAVGAFTVAVAGSAASFGLGRGVRVLSRGKFRNGAEEVGGIGTKMKNFFTGKGWTGNSGPSGPVSPEDIPPIPPSGGPKGPSGAPTEGPKIVTDTNSDLPPGWKKTPSGIVYNESNKTAPKPGESSEDLLKGPNSTAKTPGALKSTMTGWFTRDGSLPNYGPSNTGPGAASRFFGKVTGGIGNSFKGMKSGAESLGERTLNWTQGKGFINPGEGVKAKSTIKTATEQGSKGFKIANGAEDIAGATKATSTLGKIFGAGKNILGKAMLPLAAAGGIYDVFKAKSGHKGEAAGRAVGSIAGGLGGTMAAAGSGAAIGASIGSIIPVGGTVVGGLVGGAIGLGAGLLGSHIGGNIGGWIGKQFDPTKAEAAELPKSMQTKAKTQQKGKSESAKQQDRQNSQQRYQTEYKKTDNLQYERQNLHTNDDQLTKMQQILLQARQQNGIVGTLMGVGGSSFGGSSSNSSGGASPTNAKGNQASIWNHFAQQGYSSSAISGILGNIGTETGGTFDPNTKQKGGPGRGLAQWTDSGRWQNLLAYAKKTGQDPNDMQTQLQFMSQEMNQMGLTPSKMNGLSTSQATSLFEQQYEGAGKPNMSSRNNYANQAYNQFGNGGPTAAQTSYSGINGGASTSHSVNVNGNVNVNVNGNGDAASQVANNSQLQNIGQAVQQAIFGGLNFYSKEMKVT